MKETAHIIDSSFHPVENLHAAHGSICDCSGYFHGAGIFIKNARLSALSLLIFGTPRVLLFAFRRINLSNVDIIEIRSFLD